MLPLLRWDLEEVVDHLRAVGEDHHQVAAEGHLRVVVERRDHRAQQEPQQSLELARVPLPVVQQAQALELEVLRSFPVLLLRLTKELQVFRCSSKTFQDVRPRFGQTG